MCLSSPRVMVNFALSPFLYLVIISWSLFTLFSILTKRQMFLSENSSFYRCSHWFLNAVILFGYNSWYITTLESVLSLYNRILTIILQEKGITTVIVAPGICMVLICGRHSTDGCGMSKSSILCVLFCKWVQAFQGYRCCIFYIVYHPPIYNTSC